MFDGSSDFARVAGLLEVGSCVLLCFLSVKDRRHCRRDSVIPHPFFYWWQAWWFANKRRRSEVQKVFNSVSP